MKQSQRTLARTNARTLTMEELNSVSGGAYVTSTYYTTTPCCADVTVTVDTGPKPVLPA
jgi:bacteriocin-like protein